jgi:hypothetical protein
VNDVALRASLIRLAHEQPELRAELLPLLKSAAKLTKLKREIKLKSGEVVPEGTKVTVEYDPEDPALAILKVENQDAPVKVSTIHLHAYLANFQMPPPRSDLRRWKEEGESETPTGKKAPADGWAKDGSPAWTLVLKNHF